MMDIGIDHYEQEIVDVRGIWYINGEERQRFGVLSYSPTKGALLKVFGMLKDLGTCRITGLLEDGRCVTAFNATFKGVSGNLLTPEICTTEFIFFDFWEGPVAIDNRDNAQFRSVSFGIHGLDRWYHRPAFNIKPDALMSDGIEIKYQRPKSMELFSDDQVLITVEHNFKTSRISVVQNKAEIVQTQRIMIRAKNGKLPFWGDEKSFDFYIRFIHCFIGLLIGGDAFAYDFICIAEQFQQDKFGNILQYEKAFNYRRAVDLPMRVQSNALSILVPCDDEGVIVNMAKAFFVCFKKCGELLGRLLTYSYNWRTLTEYTLPELLFLFEGLSKRLYFNECRATKKKRVVDSGDWVRIEKIKQLVRGDADTTLRKIADRLFTEEPSLRDIVVTVFGKTASALPILEDPKIRSRLIDYLMKRRNGAAHAVNKSDINIQFDVWCKMFLFMDMLAMVLVYCGMSADVIKTYFVQPFTGYNFLCQKLLEEFATTENK